MYIPKNLSMPSAHEAQEFIEAYNFGVLVSGSLTGTHLPFVLARDEGELGTLYGHFAKANVHWKELDGAQAVVIFSGPHAYISPTWYASGPAVPTWNYAAVHAYGRATLLDDGETRDAVRALVRRHEPALLESCEVLTPEYESKLLAAVVGFRVELHELQGKWKLGQQRKAEDQRGVFGALSESSNMESQALAQYMAARRLGLGH